MKLYGEWYDRGQTAALDRAFKIEPFYSTQEPYPSRQERAAFEAGFSQARQRMYAPSTPVRTPEGVLTRVIAIQIEAPDDTEHLIAMVGTQPGIFRFYFLRDLEVVSDPL